MVFTRCAPVAPWYAVPLTPLLCFLVLALLLLELDSSLDAAWSLLLDPAALVSLALDFCPERDSAGVLVAFSCAAPEELIFEVALSRPVDFDELPLVELLSEDEVLGLDEEELPVPMLEPAVPEALPLPYVDDELLAGFCELVELLEPL